MNPKALLLLAILMVLFTAGSSPAVQVAKPAPAFSLNDIDGNRLSLDQFKGRVVILNFWSTTCGPCVAEIPSLNNLYNDLKGNGLSVLGISLDRSSKPVRELGNKLHIAYPLLMDSQQEVYFDSYSLFGQPVSIVIDRTGMVHDKLIGQVDWSSTQIRTKINSLLKGH